ncbi:MAG: antitoxin family protein [Rhodopirellula sp.]|nr:antitoxin family protein [Rhodopirellula sp.]
MSAKYGYDRQSPLLEDVEMSMTVRAVYQGGVFRPVHPLALDEGQTVDLTIVESAMGAASASDEETIRRLRSATTIAEWITATELLPADDGGYDIVRALNQNRIWSGERGLIPDEA